MSPMTNSVDAPLDIHDQVSHFWCPLLGQPMSFGYCRSMQNGLPCHRVLTCFEPHFNVAEFLEQNYSLEQREQFLAPAKGRMETVAEALAGVEKKDEQ